MPLSRRRNNGSYVLSGFSCQSVGRRQVRAASSVARPGTRHHGIHPVRTLRRALQAGQLRVRSVGRWKQLGERPLHGRRRARGRRVGRGAQRERELRLSAGKTSHTQTVSHNTRYPMTRVVRGWRI